MGWFAKKAQTPAVEPRPARAPEADEAEIGPATETLAGVVRIFGRYAMEIDSPDEEDFPARCEAWARHLLMGSPAPVGSAVPKPSGAPTTTAARAFADLRRFITQRRSSEQVFFTSSLSELRGTLIELVWRLRRAAADDKKNAGVMTGELDVLAEAVEQLSFTELKAQVLRSVQVVGQQLDAQASRRNEQMQTLGDQLRQMRTDLYKAQGDARRDPLTGLDNRMVLDESLERYVALAQASGEPLSAVMLDLDHFKVVNDTYGHPGGDEVLKAAAGTLVRCYLRKCDLICRYGGEEFCVLLPSTPSAEADRLTQRLLLGFRKLSVEHEGSKISFTGSAGIAELKDGETGAQLLQRADKALYAAKETGRDRLTIAE